MACKQFPNPHTGAQIALQLSKIHEEYGLSTPDKLTGTTTGNASNNLKAFKDFGLTLIDDVETEYDNTLSKMLFATASPMISNCQFSQNEIDYLIEYDLLMEPSATVLDLIQSEKNECFVWFFDANRLHNSQEV